MNQTVKMQSVIVTYNDGAVSLQRARIPVPPSDKLARAFQSNTVLYLHAKEVGYEYSWNKDGSVKMFDCNKGIMYEWITKPTMKDTIQNHSNTKGETTIFKKDGSVIRCTRPYPFSSPDTMWTFIWPANPEILLVDGEEEGDFKDWDCSVEYEQDDSSCPTCGGAYDGLDYGGLGCSRRCAYGDWMNEDRHSRHR
jgi:hypothetical protein